MKEYPVQIREILAMTVTVEAESIEQVREIVEQRWHDGVYILDADHFQTVSFSSQKHREYER